MKPSAAAARQRGERRARHDAADQQPDGVDKPQALRKRDDPRQRDKQHNQWNRTPCSHAAVRG